MTEERGNGAAPTAAALVAAATAGTKTNLNRANGTGTNTTATTPSATDHKQIDLTLPEDAAALASKTLQSLRTTPDKQPGSSSGASSSEDETSPNIMNSFVDSIVEILKNARDDIKKSTMSLRVCVLVAFLSVFVSAIMSIVKLVQISQDYTLSGYLKNPLNKDIVDYNIAESTSFSLHGFFSKYSYLMFLMFPLISIVFCIISIVLIYRVKKANGDQPEMSMILNILLLVTVIQSIIIICVNYVKFFKTRKRMQPVLNGIRTFNRYIYNNIYKDSAFLNSIQRSLSVTGQPGTSSDLVKDSLKVVMNHFDDSTTDSDKTDILTKAFFTLNMIKHFQKIGYTNPNTPDALSLFTPLKVLSLQFFTPSDYLFANGDVIEDHSISFADTYTKLNCQNGNGTSSSILNTAINDTIEHVINANNYASNLNLTNSDSDFYDMVISVCISQTAPFVFLYILFRDKSRRYAIFNFLGKLLSSLSNRG